MLVFKYLSIAVYLVYEVYLQLSEDKSGATWNTEGKLGPFLISFSLEPSHFWVWPAQTSLAFLYDLIFHAQEIMLQQWYTYDR